jgi:hypothetical protein
MVMRDLGAHVVQNVSLGDPVRQETTEPSEDWACAREELTIEGGESTSLAKKRDISVGG